MKKQVLVILFFSILISCVPPKQVETPTANFDKRSATQSAKTAECEALDKLAIVSEKTLLPSETISGPAEIMPNPYIAIISLSTVLGLDMPVAGGVIVKSGNSVNIPKELTLAPDNILWIPDGNVITYTSDDLMWSHIKCWTAAKSP
jgi:hypothetical protein